LKSFLNLSKDLEIIDVRSPIEYNKGHIPNAHNVYLFSDEDRHKIGIVYKQHGKDKAILAGLDIIGPKMKRIVNKVHSITGDKKSLDLLLAWWNEK
jgi:tRNA 2-selenouridine synthase